MSLLITNGTAVLPTPLPGLDQKVLKKLQRFEQDQNAWCYAACASMVLDYYGQKVKQCVIVDFVMRGNCCLNQTSETCNGNGAKPKDIKRIYKKWGSEAVSRRMACSYMTRSSRR